jgi:phenylalanyl-tRNA synthetase beta subunit
LPGGAIARHSSGPLRQSQTVRAALVGAGLAEVVTYAFTDPAKAELLRRTVDPKPVELMNPLAQDASLLRVNPLEGVLSAVGINVRRQQPDVRVFEITKTYQTGSGTPRQPNLGGSRSRYRLAERAGLGRSHRAGGCLHAKGCGAHARSAWCARDRARAGLSRADCLGRS